MGLLWDAKRRLVSSPKGCDRGWGALLRLFGFQVTSSSSPLQRVIDLPPKPLALPPVITATGSGFTVTDLFPDSRTGGMAWILDSLGWTARAAPLLSGSLNLCCLPNSRCSPCGRLHGRGRRVYTQSKVMEEFLRKELCTTTLRHLGASSGCISNGSSYETDSGNIFVKCNSDSEVICRVLIESAQRTYLLASVFLYRPR